MTKEALITNVSCNLQKQAGIAYAIGIENVSGTLRLLLRRIHDTLEEAQYSPV